MANVCGAFFNTLFVLSITDSSISFRIESMASQNLSSSAKPSLSVGSIIIVPATGKDTVGA